MVSNRFFIFSLNIFVISIQSANLLGYENNDCLRDCNVETEPKRCRYDFYVTEFSDLSRRCNDSGEENDESYCLVNRIQRHSLLINGKSPGPSIEICLRDTLEVYLHNKLDFEISFHWHGIQQKGSVHMDGVPMVTQCPIPPFSAFRYEMKPDKPGTYFYHAHSVLQQADGLYGALIVRIPDDIRLSEKVLLLSSRSMSPLTTFSQSEFPRPIELLINGQSNGSQIDVEEGTRYLLRFVNAAAFNCPISFSIAKHLLKVTATDGNEAESLEPGTHVIIFPDERLDALLETNQKPGKYFIGLQGLLDCQNLFHQAVLTYFEAPSEEIIKSSDVYLSPKILEPLQLGYDCNKVSKNIICSLDLKMSLNELRGLDEPTETIYIPFDVNTFGAITDEMTDESFNIYDYTYYPAYLSLQMNGTKIAQVNRMTFQYPSSPILSQPENTPEELICSLESRSKLCENTPIFCECVQILEIPPKKLVELILIDEGFGSNTSYTFHVHGYHVNIVGRHSFGKPISKEKIISLYQNKELPYNLIDSPKKDTFVVPNKGYVIVRFYTDNLGYWLWEARSTGILPAITGPGMQFLMRVGHRENLPMVPINFPTCGNNKRPGMIFETELEL